jgi:dephospho-CoA kinase
MKVVAVVGMPGSGKSEVARRLERRGFTVVRFGDITDEEIARRGMEISEKNERYIRELLRQEHGMAAYARLNLPRIETALQQSSVAVDGLYSWEEYILLKSHYGERFLVLAVWSSPATRYSRLAHRTRRPLTPAEARKRDYAELEKVNKGGPIAMADHLIANEGSLADLEKAADRIIGRLA